MEWGPMSKDSPTPQLPKLRRGPLPWFPTRFPCYLGVASGRRIGSATITERFGLRSWAFADGKLLLNGEARVAAETRFLMDPSRTAQIAPYSTNNHQILEVRL